MLLLSVPQPWATLLSRGAARFVVRDDATDYRGTVAIHAADVIDPETVERLETDTEFAERMAALGFTSVADVEALPRDAIVGVAVIADLWGIDALEEVATEDDAIFIGDVADTAVFWELAESVEIAAIAQPGTDFEPMSDAVASAVQNAAQQVGARFDHDGLVFWPVTPTAALASLIGDDAVGDREITSRVWAYVVEHDLQDAEDNAYVYLDDSLRSALARDDDGMPTIEFTECIVAQMQRTA
jgi:hypothetical protein